MIGGAKHILGCSSRTCNEAVRGDMGLDSLQGRRDKAKLKWWYKVATMPEHRYSRKLFVQEWNVKPRRGIYMYIGKGSIGVRLSTFCFLHWALIRQSGWRTFRKEVVHLRASWV